MLLDAFNDNADTFVLVSGDTDFIAPVNIIRKDFKKTVIVFNPRETKSWLKDYASYYRDIPRNLPAECQLPGFPASPPKPGAEKSPGSASQPPPRSRSRATILDGDFAKNRESLP